ncbi:UNVERIFIED_CONTAM: hypothetical protein Slati_0181600 [Sesamum latifolium]|uniref:Uncharacterized protein n=1 Tax=Sesamum latifolium TaxID=2727402 RepID=A0AAW2YAU1_9LAMI
MNGEETQFGNSVLPAASELVKEKGTKLLKASYHGRGQLVEPLLRGPGKSSDEDSTLDAVDISMQQGCILKSGQVLLWIDGAIVLLYGWGPRVHR